MTRQRIPVVPSAISQVFQQVSRALGSVSLACTLFGGIAPLIQLSKWAELFIENWEVWTRAIWSFLFGWLVIEVTPTYASCLNLIACMVMLLAGPHIRGAITRLDTERLFDERQNIANAAGGLVVCIASIYIIMTPGLSYLWHYLVENLEGWGFSLLLVTVLTMPFVVFTMISLSVKLPYFSRGLITAGIYCSALVLLNAATPYLEDLQLLLNLD